MNNAYLVLKDLKHIWHPCSQMKDYKSLVPLVPIKKAKGSYLYDFDGNRYLDSISSWWVNLFGHQNRYIDSAIKKQLKELAHTIFAGFTHKSIIDLSNKLIKLTDKKLNKIFFADNGSSAVEISLKMAFQYFKNSGEVRDKFISLQNSYHGETMGALAVGDVSLYKDTYKEILIQTLQAKSPALVSEDEAIEDIDKLLKTHVNRVSAIIIEPLVQCAGNMKMYNASYITKLSQLCKKYGVFLIADEIAVGFGRTGTMFAYEQSEAIPDFLLLSKGITGGYLPLSVVMTSDDIYDKFYCDYGENKSFLDSHSYTGNALATAAANATLDIFENDNVIENNSKKIRYISKLLEKFKKLDRVKRVDQRGMIASITLNNFDYKNRENLKIYNYCLKNEVLLRPLLDTIYFMPHYTFSYKELDKMSDVAYSAIKSL